MVDESERRLKIAALRYRMIAEAVESLGGDVAWAIEEAARRSYPDPDGGELIEVTPRTLWRFLAAYREGGLLALQPKVRKDRGQLRAVSPEMLEAAARLRRENENRPTKTIIDILERTHKVGKGELARATLDRHLDKMGLSRRRLHRLGKTTYKKILTEAPFELVVADFHHGPYVRVESDPSSSNTSKPPGANERTSSNLKPSPKSSITAAASQGSSRTSLSTPCSSPWTPG
jgi:hypothetical protein